MTGGTSIIIDLLGGAAVLGDTIVPVTQAGPNGEIQLDGIDGPVLRPLTFGERSRAVSLAAASTSARDNLCAEMLRLATTHSGTAEQATQEILALVLAGADLDAPSFVETLLLVAQATGWDAMQISCTQAADIDRLAAYVSTPQPGSEWNQLLLAPREDELLHVIRARLADTLLRRHSGPSPDRQPDQATNSVNAAGGNSSTRVRAIQRDVQSGTAAPPLADADARPDASPIYGTLDNQGAAVMLPVTTDSDPALPIDCSRADAGAFETGLTRGSAGAPDAVHHVHVAAQAPGSAIHPRTVSVVAHQLHTTPGRTSTVSPRVDQAIRSIPAWSTPIRGEASPVEWRSNWSPLAAAVVSPAWHGMDQPDYFEPRRDQPQRPEEQASDPLLRLADNLAALLHAEADMRGIDP